MVHKPKVAVVGTGRAGRARLAALERRTDVDGLGISVRGPDLAGRLESALHNSDVQAVIVCAANAQHFWLAQTALNAGKHTLVEFPLCYTRSDAAALFALAKQKQLVLHVEFIGLMTPAHLGLLAVPKGRIASVKVEMSGSYYRWVKDDAERGLIGPLLVGRLQALDQCFGRLSPTEVAFNHHTEGYNVSLTLASAQGVDVSLKDQRGETLSRRRKIICFDHEEKPIKVKAVPSDVGLFDADLDVFLRKTRGEETGWNLPSSSDVLRVMGLADHISLACRAQMLDCRQR